MKLPRQRDIGNPPKSSIRATLATILALDVFVVLVFVVARVAR